MPITEEEQEKEKTTMGRICGQELVYLRGTARCVVSVEILPINNNNNSHDNVYGAVIMTKVIAKVHPVHPMNVD